MKVSDSYDSLIKGVSQQVPHDRLIGQHWEQENLISDPVRGLSRRHGSQLQDRVALTHPIGPLELRDAATRAEQTLFIDGIEYSVMYPKASTGSQLNPVIVVNKNTRKFIPVVYADANARTELTGGITSVVAAGKFVLLSSAAIPTTYTQTNPWNATRQKSVIWVRGGANSRAFSVTIDASTGPATFTYTTMPAYYEGVLDTSDIDPLLPGPEPRQPDPLYSKKVNDRVNAYNTAVNQHLAAVAKDITPANIALKLTEKILAAGITVGCIDSYILIDQDLKSISASDSGNGDFIRVVAKDIVAPEETTPKHYAGKVVKVTPRQANSLPYYLKAVSTDGVGGFGSVIWRETAGIEVKPLRVFSIGVFQGGALVVASSALSLQAATGVLVPDFSVSSAGDLESAPLPEWMGRVITHMQMFQDRLMLVAGSTVFLSKSGDYFNFFRKSILTLADDDPIEVFAQGTEDDIITSGVQNDRNVILCGQRYQYLVPGKEAMTPRNPYVGVMSAYEGANLAQHAVAGGLLFFCQRREKRLTLQQMSPGSVVDRLEAYDVSSQLDGYLTGTPSQIVALTAPGVVFVRTAEQPNAFYVYSFLDTADNSNRLFDSWSRWSFDSSLGSLVGLTSDDSGLLAATLRNSPAGPMIVLDRFTRETGESAMPFLDSLTPYAVDARTPQTFVVAYDDTSERHLLGGTLKEAPALNLKWPTDAPALQMGAVYDSYVDLTSPYVRDKDGKLILDARLTVTKLTVSMTNSAAMTAEMRDEKTKLWRTIEAWVHRALGGWQLSIQEVATEATVTVPVMKENKQYRMRLRSRNWLPLTLSVVEWAGQKFTNRR